MDRNKFVLTLHVMSVVSLLVCLILIFTDTRVMSFGDLRAIIWLLVIIIASIVYFASLFYGIYLLIKSR